MKKKDESGAATAEAAMVIPTLVLIAVGLCWLVSVGVAQVRVVDAAREAARSLARGEDPDRALGLARAVAPDGAVVGTASRGGLVVVTVRAPVRAPGGLLRFPGFTARASAVAAGEDAAGSSG